MNEAQINAIKIIQVCYMFSPYLHIRLLTTITKWTINVQLRVILYTRYTVLQISLLLRLSQIKGKILLFYPLIISNVCVSVGNILGFFARSDTNSMCVQHCVCFVDWYHNVILKYYIYTVLDKQKLHLK